MSRQKIVHSYGHEDYDISESEILEEIQRNSAQKSTTNDIAANVQPPKGARINVGDNMATSACRCGSTTHRRVTNKSCSLYKPRQKKNDCIYILQLEMLLVFFLLFLSA